MHKRSLLGLLLSTSLAHAATTDISMFPAPDADQQRHVIRLPPLADETTSQVEILLSQKRQVDCNRQRLSGNLTSQDVKGWGYPYYRLDKVIGPMTTMMACPNQQKKTAAVPVLGDGYLLRYNSKLPLVIYTPKGLDVRYRIWHTDPEGQPAKQE